MTLDQHRRRDRRGTLPAPAAMDDNVLSLCARLNDAPSRMVEQRKGVSTEIGKETSAVFNDVVLDQRRLYDLTRARPVLGVLTHVEHDIDSRLRKGGDVRALERKVAQHQPVGDPVADE